MVSASVSTREHARKRASGPDPVPGVAHTFRRSALTRTGLLFVVVTMFLALGAINGQNNLLFWLFGFSIAAVFVSGLVTGNALMSLRIVAHNPPVTEARSPTTLTYTLINTSRLLPNFALELVEVPGEDMSGAIVCERPGGALHLPPRSHKMVSAQLVPQRRGVHELNRVRIRTRFPFGLFMKSVEFEVPRRLTVFPEVIAFDRDRAESIVRNDESPSRHMAQRGAGLEYYGLRDYRAGDPIQNIAWKQSARSPSLLVVEYPDPAARVTMIELQRPDDTVSDQLFEQAVSVVYTIMKESHQRHRLGLSIPWGGVFLPPNLGSVHFHRAGLALARLSRDPVQTGSRGRVFGSGSKGLVVRYKGTRTPGDRAVIVEELLRGSEHSGVADAP